MVKRRQKKRTHIPEQNPAEAGIPQSMVLRIGGASVGVSLSQLVQDFRDIMQPHTAVKLRERKSNKLRDYLSMTGPLGVSHLLLFSKSIHTNETTLRIAHAPRGPTVHFRVVSYSLCKDLRRVQRHPRVAPTTALQTPPLLVLNGFNAVKEEEKVATAAQKAPLQLITSLFQNMVPSITASTKALQQIKRVMLVNYEPTTGELDLRHYLISTKTLARPPKEEVKVKVEDEDDEVEIKTEDEEEEDDRDTTFAKTSFATPHTLDSDSDASASDDDNDNDKFLPAAPSYPPPSRARLTKLISARSRLSKSLPHLGSTADIADYLLDPSAGGDISGVTSESEAEDDDMFDATALMPQRRNDTAGGAGTATRKAVKLLEIGPRLRLKLIKIQDGVCEGDVLYHAFHTEKPAGAKRAKAPGVHRKKKAGAKPAGSKPTGVKPMNDKLMEKPTGAKPMTKSPSYKKVSAGGIKKPTWKGRPSSK
ncbi:Brix domain-containing protein [Limtongia smithiae]|uniref:Brix domain-containing protein n=1 Tax=Limtongia smithiae TaxID=1125753 RepID=UPI0034CF8D76